MADISKTIDLIDTSSATSFLSTKYYTYSGQKYYVENQILLSGWNDSYMYIYTYELPYSATPTSVNMYYYIHNIYYKDLNDVEHTLVSSNNTRITAQTQNRTALRSNSVQLITSPYIENTIHIYYREGVSNINSTETDHLTLTILPRPNIKLNSSNPKYIYLNGDLMDRTVKFNGN